MLRLASIAALLVSLSLIGCASSTSPPPAASPGIAAPITSNEIRPKKPLPIQWVQGDLIPSSMQECRDVELRLTGIHVQASGTRFIGTIANRGTQPRKLRSPLTLLGTVCCIAVRINGSEEVFEFVLAPDAPMCAQYSNMTTPWILSPGEESKLDFRHYIILVRPKTKSRLPAGAYRARWEILYSVNDIEYEDFVKVCATDDNVVTVWIDAEKAATADAPK